VIVYDELCTTLSEHEGLLNHIPTNSEALRTVCKRLHETVKCLEVIVASILETVRDWREERTEQVSC
jgi:hypothetical protein